MYCTAGDWEEETTVSVVSVSATGWEKDVRVACTREKMACEKLMTLDDGHHCSLEYANFSCIESNVE